MENQGPEKRKDKLDLTAGVPADRLPDGGMLAGNVGEEEVVLVHSGGQFFAVGNHCTHYGQTLSDGLVTGDHLRCPFHHACFDLRTGEAVRAPALDPLPCWRVEQAGGRVFVREKLTPSKAARAKNQPESVVIVGGGAAGLAAAEMLRRLGYEGSLTMLSADDAAPYDRPNASKDYLAGTAPEEYMPLRPPEFYTGNRIDLVLNSRVASVNVASKGVVLENGQTYEFDALLLATGAEPVKLPVPGASASQIHYLRTLSDSRDLIAKAATAKQVVIAGASFIGLEVAASLRARGVAVHVVAPERQPFERILGPEVGAFVRRLHEEHGVVFHLGETVVHVDGRNVVLSGGGSVDADLLVLGVGVRPALALAEQAGLKVDRGVIVNQFLETSAPGIFAAGDIARWPYGPSGELARVEHWVVAERQGQTAARNILGLKDRFNSVPFFWTDQYGVFIKYIGHAERWDTAEIDADLNARDCIITYKSNGRRLAVATISRDIENLQAEVAMEAEFIPRSR